MRRTPKSTLFPYTTLFRSVFDRHQQLVTLRQALEHLAVHRLERSEEHTSELQSLTNLVCRLLLEKKKKMWHRIGGKVLAVDASYPEVDENEKESRNENAEA